MSEANNVVRTAHAKYLLTDDQFSKYYFMSKGKGRELTDKEMLSCLAYEEAETTAKRPDIPSTGIIEKFGI